MSFLNWKPLLFLPLFKQLMISPTQDSATGVRFMTGVGAPTEVANNGSVYFRQDGAAGTTLYLRISAAWVAVPGIGGGGSFTTLAASGATALASTLSVAGAATLNGNVTLGNATSDDITVTGRLASSVLPKTTNLYDLGSTSLRYAAGWFAGAVTAAGGFVGDLTGNASTATKLASASYFTSTVQTGTGSAQNIAHGLGVTPSAVIPFLGSTAGDPAIVLGTADATNCVVTAGVGVTYRVVAIK
jgi:hypothetical protein